MTSKTVCLLKILATQVRSCLVPTTIDIILRCLVLFLGLQKNTQYETFTLFHQHICQVCGSYQCPYCPFYNKVPSCTNPFKTLLLLSFISISLVLRWQNKVD